MKAAAIKQHGNIDCIVYTDVPDPVLNSGEVILEVKAAALNHLDIWVRNGRPGASLQMPHVIGSDAAGVIDAMGEGVEGWKVGDEVILNPGLSCGKCEFCFRGEQSECPGFGIIGLSRPGTFAQKIAVPAANLQRKPKHLTFDEAAALPLAHLTAWRMLMARAVLRPGETVLIHGIGGGVALAALQLAKLTGAHVIVTSSSDEKLERALELGADRTINYRKTPDFAKEAREYTAGRGVDIVVDAIGAATWASDFVAVRRGGRIVLCGITTGAEAMTPLRILYWNQVSVHGSTMGSHEDFRLMINAVENDNLCPVIDSIVPLENAKEAIARMESGEQFGKIVLTL